MVVKHFLNRTRKRVRVYYPRRVLVSSSCLIAAEKHWLNVNVLLSILSRTLQNSNNTPTSRLIYSTKLFLLSDFCFSNKCYHITTLANLVLFLTHKHNESPLRCPITKPRIGNRFKNAVEKKRVLILVRTRFFHSPKFFTKEYLPRAVLA